MPTQFRGSHTVTITPFTEGGKKIDLPAWKRFVDWQIKTGVPGIIILGTTGEFLTLTDEERRGCPSRPPREAARAHAGDGGHDERSIRPMR
jgi:dihydrodipicolinate synthase/N-acetylneuraminate lyase